MNERHSGETGLSPMEQLAARWDTVAFRAQGSPYEDLTIASLAKSTGTKNWMRPGGKIKGDTVARYVYLSFDELLEIEKLDMKSATQLLEISEATFLFEEECEDIGSFEEIDNQAYSQRMRFVEEFGLYQDYPVKLANLDADLRELCTSEEIISFLDLMEFLDRLSDKAWIGGSYKKLQNVFAHGDEKGLIKYFPYRLGHRGFHFPEAVSFCLNRISKKNDQLVREYHERRRKRNRFVGKRPDFPEVLEKHLIPEIFECLIYFGHRQPHLLVRIHDSAYLCRELMFLNDPQTESILHWLIHLATATFSSSVTDVEEDELDQLSSMLELDSCQELRELSRES